ncbi:MAG TPA: zf-HC2 domain-containing protein [Candidatus Binatia bacterium]|jgi:hypothetical protein
MAKPKGPPSAADKTCNEMTALVLGYLTGTLSANVKRDFEHHLTICPDCVSFLNTYKKTVAATQSVEPSDIPAPVRDSILSFLRKRIRRIGALIIYILTQSLS